MTKRKLTLSLIAVGAVTGLILIAVAVVGSLISSWVALPERLQFKIVSSSPRQTYAITVERKQRELTEDDRTSWKIYLSYASQGQQVLNEVEVDAGDFSNSPYWDERPQLNWIYENTFRLDDTASLPESESDVLFVRNDSASALSYLYVNGEANERFFILNLEPQASVKLYARPQWKRGDSSGFYGSGRFITGGMVLGGKSFRLPHSAKGPGRYCLSVEENAITVVSRDFEGYELREFTPEERKQNEEDKKKFEARRGTEVDGKKSTKFTKNAPKLSLRNLRIVATRTLFPRTANFTSWRHDSALVLTANWKHERRQIPVRIARASAYCQSNSIPLARPRSSFREANGTAIAIPDLACRLQFVSRSVYEAKLCKGGKQL